MEGQIDALPWITEGYHVVLAQFEKSNNLLEQPNKILTNFYTESNEQSQNKSFYKIASSSEYLFSTVLQFR